MASPTLSQPKRSKTYPDAVRLQAVQAVRENRGNVGRTARELGIPDETLRGWCRVYGARLTQLNLEPVAPFFSSERGRLAAQLTGREKYSESELTNAIAANIETICGDRFASPAQRVITQHALPNGRRLDLLIRHEDESLTIGEVKAASGRYAKMTGWLLYPAIGQLLYHAEVLSADEGVSVDKINLILFTDYAPDEYFSRAFSRVTASVAFIDVSPFFRPATPEYS